MKYSPEEYNYFVNWALYAILGRLSEADGLMQRFGGPIRSMAKKLVKLLGVPARPVYRGMVLDPGAVGDDLVLSADPNYTFVSFSEDRDVACWFADRDSVISGFVRQLRPQISGWIAESWPDKKRVLFHWSWATRFPLPNGQQGPLWLFAQHHPDMIPAQVEWAMRSQKEVILRQDGKPLKVIPYAQAGCPPTAELDARLTFRPNPPLSLRYLAELWTDIQEVARWVRLNRAEQTRGPIVYFTVDQAIQVAYRGKGDPDGDAASRWVERWKRKIRDNMPGVLLPGDPAVAYRLGQHPSQVYGLDEHVVTAQGNKVLAEAAAERAQSAEAKKRQATFEHVLDHFGVSPGVPLEWISLGAPHRMTRAGPKFDLGELRLWVALQGMGPLPPLKRKRNLRTSQLSQALGVPVKTIHSWSQRYEMPSARATGKGTGKGERLRFSLPEVKEWLVQTGRTGYLEGPAPGASLDFVRREATSADVRREFGVGDFAIMEWRKAGMPHTDLRELRKTDPLAADELKAAAPTRSVRFFYNLDEIREWHSAQPRLRSAQGVRLPIDRVAPRLREILAYLNVWPKDFAEMLGIGIHALRGYLQTSAKPVETVPKFVLDKAEELRSTLEPRVIKHVKQTSATKEELEDALARSGGIRDRARLLLGISRGAFNKLADRYGVSYEEPMKPLVLSGISRDDIRGAMEANKVRGKYETTVAARDLGMSGGQSLWSLIGQYGMEGEFSSDLRARGTAPAKADLKKALVKSEGDFERAASALGVHPETVRRFVVHYKLRDHVKKQRASARKKQVKAALKEARGSIPRAGEILGIGTESARAAMKRHDLVEYRKGLIAS